MDEVSLLAASARTNATLDHAKPRRPEWSVVEQFKPQPSGGSEPPGIQALHIEHELALAASLVEARTTIGRCARRLWQTRESGAHEKRSRTHVDHQGPMPPATLTKLDSVTFDELVRQQQPLQAVDPVFDLSSITLITPSPMVQIAAVCHALAEEGRTPTVKLGDGVRGYLERCGFFAVVGDWCEREPQDEWRSAVYASRRGSNPMLIELTYLRDGSSLPDLLTKVVWVLRYRLKYAKYDAYDIATVVSELCQNTFDHNASTAGFVAMQVYGKEEKRFLEIAVSDHGGGLLATLLRNPKNGAIRTDLDAIKAAIKLGTSEHDDPTRGTGLYHLLNIAYKHKGSVQIKSGGSKVRYRMDKEEGWAFAVTAIPGVHITVSLPSKAARAAA